MISNCGHDERGKLKGGKAGDQTGTEWYIRSWYNGGWKCVIRFPENIRECIATNAEKAARNNLVGYDQNQRTTYYSHLKASNWDASKISVACEADCSAGVSANIIAAGYILNINTLKNFNKNNTTSSLRAACKAVGATILTDSKYLTSDKYLLRGDIILKDGSHVTTNLTNGAMLSTNTNKPSTNTSYSKTQFIRDVQLAIGAKPDGIAGTETLSKTITVSKYKNQKHPVVLPLQKYLNAIGYNCGAADGCAGVKFDSAVKAYQKAVIGMRSPDGVITAKQTTWKKLLGM